MPRPKAETPTFSLTNKVPDRPGWWYVQWWDGSRARRISCRTQSGASARRFLAEFRVEAASDPAPEQPTIGRILEGYLTVRAKRRHSKSLEYDVATLRRHLGDLPADLMNTAQSERYCAARQAEPRRQKSAQYRKTQPPLSNGTLIRELGVLRRGLAWAVEEKWLDAAPHVSRPSAPPARERWLTREECDAVQRAATAPHARLFIAIAGQTGARMSAILELKWSQIDLVHRRIDFGAGHGNKQRSRPPITERLLPDLLRASEAATTEYVIEYAGGPIKDAGAGVRAAGKRAGVPGVTPHVFRHTAITWMVMDDVPFPVIGRYVGTTAAMIEKHYGHHSPSYLARAARSLSRPMDDKTESLDRAEVQ